MEKGKQGILKVIFGRTTILIALLLFQLLVLFWLFSVLAQYIDTVYIYVLYQVFVAVLVLYIVNQEENPAFKLAWILPVLIFPVFGAPLCVCEAAAQQRAAEPQAAQTGGENAGFCTAGRTSDGKLNREHPGAAGIASYLLNRECYPVYENTAVKYLPLGEDKFAELKIQLKKAQHFIFLEYFIIEEGEMWDTVLDILKEKVREEWKSA